MIDEAPAAKPRSKRLYILWAIALTLLLGLGLFSWLVVVPVWRARALVAEYAEELQEPLSDTPEPEASKDRVSQDLKFIERLGGPVRATEALSTYLRLPDGLCPDKRLVLILLARCGRRPEVVIREIDGYSRVQTFSIEIRPTENTAALDEVVHTLTSVAAGSDIDLSLCAIDGLAWLGPEAQAAVPTLEALSRNPNRPAAHRTLATQALKKIRAAQEKKK